MPLITSGAIKGRRCPICGAEHTSCGLPYQGNAVAIPREPTMVDIHDLYIYRDAAGNTFQTTEADGRESGYTRAGSEPVAIAEREREAAGGAAASAPEPPSESDSEAKAQEPAANKARTPAENK